MKRSILSALILATILTGYSNASIFDPAQQTQEQIVADEVANIVDANARLKAYINNMHTRIFNAIWNNPKITPQEVFDQFGTSSVELFTFSYNLQTMLCEANGGSVQDGLCVDGEYSTLVPGYSYTLNEDGTVTVGDKIATEETAE